jgi:hypothetical protein
LWCWYYWGFQELAHLCHRYRIQEEGTGKIIAIQNFIAGHYITGQVGKIIDVGDKSINIGIGARKCPNCGRKVDTKENFCIGCGAKL